MDKIKKIFKIDDVFTHIFKISLLYMNPANVSQMRNKDKYRDDPEKIYGGLIKKTYGLGSLAILIVYFMIFMAIDFKNTPYLLDYSLVFLLIINILYTFTYFYNVFYDSKDLESYMNLPIKESTLFRAKLFAISIGCIQMGVPIFAITTVFFMKMGLGPISIVYSLIEFFVFGAFSVIANMLFTQLLVRSSILSRLKKKFITIIGILSMVLNIAFIIMIQNIGKSAMLKTLQSKVVIYGPISSLIDSHIGNLIFILIGSAIIFFIYKLIMRGIDGRYFDYIKRIQGDFSSSKKENNDNDDNDERNKRSQISSKEKKSSGFSSGSLTKIFIRYNLGLLGEQNIIATSIVTPAIFPIVIIFSNFMSGDNFFPVNPDFSTRILIGVGLATLIAVMSSNQNTGLPAIMISLDRENLDYMKSIPISMKKYINIKLLLSSAIISVIPMISFIIVSIVNDVGILGIIIGIVLLVLLILSASFYWLRYDYEHVLTSWQNVTELYNRMGKAWLMLFMFISVFFIMVGMVLIGLLARLGNSSLILLLSISLILGFCLFTYTRYRKFIKKLD